MNPKSSLLGVGKLQMESVWNGSVCKLCLICLLSLSFDHCVIAGAAGMRFTVFLATCSKTFVAFPCKRLGMIKRLPESFQVAFSNLDNV